MSRKTILMVGIGVFVFAVLVARALAPAYVLQYVNRTLDGLGGYAGRVDEIDLHIWRGAYEIEGVKIVKTGGKQPVPFISLERADISIQWGALLDGAIVGEVDLYGPKLNFVAEKQKESKAEDQTEKREAKKATTGDSSWQKQLKELVPLEINRIGIHDGEIHYRDVYTEPEVDIYVQKLRGQLTNLTNSEDLSESMVARASFRALALGSGALTLDARADPYQKSPTFTLSAKLENLQAKQLNDFLKAYANVDAEEGRISVYTEVSAAKGRFRGYVKPLIRDLRLLRWKDEEEGALGRLWEGLVEAGTELFENHSKEQVATRIPFEGKLESPDADIGTTVLFVLKNAFIRALKGGLDCELGEDGKQGLARRDERE